MRLIYLDYNSTTPIAGAAREAMLPFLYEFYGSPNTSHWTGAAVAEAIEDARSNVALLLDCESHEVVFTSGGTESVNLAVRSGMQALQQNFGDRCQLVLTPWEYTPSHRAAAALSASGHDVQVVCSGGPAGWDPAVIAQSVGDRPTLLTLTLADGETGIIQPIQELAELLSKNGQREHCLIHLDCCQAVGKIDVSADRLDADLLSISGHKMYASKGIGALVVRNLTAIEPLLYGEWYERGFRNGTPNVPGVIALGAAAQLVSKSVRKFAMRSEQLFLQFDETTKQCLGSTFDPIGKSTRLLCNTRLFLLPDRDATAVLQRVPELCVKHYDHASINGHRINGHLIDDEQEEKEFDDDSAYGMILNNETISIGELDETAFNSLAAAALSAAQQRSAIRLSVGWNTTDADMIHAAESISEAYQQSDDN